MEHGYLAILLHSHLPFVRHPEHAHFLQEDWLFEAITETYIPLIMLFEELISRKIEFGITISLTPTLCEMFADPLLQERYIQHIHALRELAEEEVQRTEGAPEHKTALMYKENFSQVANLFEESYGGNLLNPLQALAGTGSIELIASAATHSFLPNLLTDTAKRAQIRAGINNFRKHFGYTPRGFWLPECGYNESIGRLLAEEGIHYTILDTHGMLYGNPKPPFGFFSPVISENRIIFFGRDKETSVQVWSAQHGYPGDGDYREFYRDVGFDRELDYIAPYLKPEGIRKHLGIKYHRITGSDVDLSHKQLYDPKLARHKATEHAGDFLFNRQQQVRHWHSILGRKPIIVAPYDAELFGHWWYEGPDFLKYFFLKSYYDQDEIRPVTFLQYLRENPNLPVVNPAASSWGAGGYFEVWLNNSNDWIYRHLHYAEQRIIKLAQQNRDASGLLLRALNQAARELLLAQASDWPFIISTGTAVEYAEKRVKDHLHRLLSLADQIERDAIDPQFLADVESKDNIFSELNFSLYLPT